VARFLSALGRPARGTLVFDLGCGPGPTTKLLAEAGYQVRAVDFSSESLRLNRMACKGIEPQPGFECADLRHYEFPPNAADGLMMSDFVQHLGSPDVQRDFLTNAFSALRRGGWFYLSFFNFNFVNRWKGDRSGTFSEGAIAYHRMTSRERLAMLPADIVVERIAYSNISHDPALDRLLCALPGAGLAARWVIMSGQKPPLPCLPPPMPPVSQLRNR
jgi:SAM-dependent methyltransferase